MFPGHYWPARYYAGRYWPKAGGMAPGGGYFPGHYFAGTYFPARYFPKRTGAQPAAFPVVSIEPWGVEVLVGIGLGVYPRR